MRIYFTKKEGEPVLLAVRGNMCKLIDNTFQIDLDGDKEEVVSQLRSRFWDAELSYAALVDGVEEREFVSSEWPELTRVYDSEEQEPHHERRLVIVTWTDAGVDETILFDDSPDSAVKDALSVYRAMSRKSRNRCHAFYVTRCLVDSETRATLKNTSDFTFDVRRFCEQGVHINPDTLKMSFGDDELDLPEEYKGVVREIMSNPNRDRFQKAHAILRLEKKLSERKDTAEDFALLSYSFPEAEDTFVDEDSKTEDIAIEEPEQI